MWHVQRREREVPPGVVRTLLSETCLRYHLLWCVIMCMEEGLAWWYLKQASCTLYTGIILSPCTSRACSVERRAWSAENIRKDEDCRRKAVECKMWHEEDRM